MRLLNALNSEDRGLKVRFSLAMIVFQTFELILCQMLASQGKNAPSDPYPHYLVRLATSRTKFLGTFGPPPTEKTEKIGKIKGTLVRKVPGNLRSQEFVFFSCAVFLPPRSSLRLLNALNSEDRAVKVRFSLATIAFDRESAQMSEILSSQGKNAPSDPYPHYLVRLAASRLVALNP